MINYYKKILFPIHLFQANIRENPLIQSDILQSIQTLYTKKNLEIPEGWLTDNIFTTFNKDQINSHLFNKESKIVQYYHQYVRKFFDEPVEFEIDDIWLNVYSNGEYQEEHTHLTPDIFMPRSHFSCIHYLKFDPDVHVPVTFVDPIATMRYNTLEMKSNRYLDRWSPRISEGDLIMFPPYLGHFVSKSEPTPDNPRISVAFNIRIHKYGDQGKDGN